MLSPNNNRQTLVDNAYNFLQLRIVNKGFLSYRLLTTSAVLAIAMFLVYLFLSLHLGSAPVLNMHS